MRRRHAGRRAASAGFTIAEVLVTVVILGVAVLSASWTMSGAVQAKGILSAEEVTASLLAREIHAVAQVLPREPSGTVGVTVPGNVVALDSLIGAEFSPPMRADGSTDPVYTQWTQQVGLTVHALADLSPTGESAADGLAEDGDRLYKLVVVVLDPDGAIAGTFSWWLNP